MTRTSCNKIELLNKLTSSDYSKSSDDLNSCQEESSSSLSEACIFALTMPEMETEQKLVTHECHYLLNSDKVPSELDFHDLPIDHTVERGAFDSCFRWNLYENWLHGGKGDGAGYYKVTEIHRAQMRMVSDNEMEVNISVIITETHCDTNGIVTRADLIEEDLEMCQVKPNSLMCVFYVSIKPDAEHEGYVNESFVVMPICEHVYTEVDNIEEFLYSPGKLPERFHKV